MHFHLPKLPRLSRPLFRRRERVSAEATPFPRLPVSERLRASRRRFLATVGAGAAAAATGVLRLATKAQATPAEAPVPITQELLAAYNQWLFMEMYPHLEPSRADAFLPGRSISPAGGARSRRRHYRRPRPAL